jgi:hypothetical protein
MSAIASGVELDSGAVDGLATSFGGNLIRPADAAYDDQRRIWTMRFSSPKRTSRPRSSRPASTAG